jgi:cytochrome c oxidase subunit IV
MRPVLRRPVTGVWLVLVLATMLSWLLGGEPPRDGPGRQTGLTAAVLVIAFMKVRLIVLHFMEVRDAPRALRLILEAWIVLVLGLLLGLYLLA